MKEVCLMKKITKIIFIMIFLIFSIIVNGSVIKNYDVVMKINKESSLIITEKIEYEFDNLDHRGIFRDIFLRKEDKKNLKKSLIEINSVTMNGEKVKYAFETFDEGLRIKIGSKDKKITQLKNTYEITYTMYSDIFKHEDIQQIYFNIIPQFWKVPIEKANVTIKFADGQPITSEEISRFEIYTGRAGVKEKNYKILQENGEIKFTTQKQLEPKEGITFLLDLKTDKISPSFSDKLKVFFTTSKSLVLSLILALISLIYMLITKLILFLKQPSKKAIIPQFEIPDDMSAMLVSYFDNKDDRNKIINTGIFSRLCRNFKKKSYDEEKKFFVALISKKGKGFKITDHDVESLMENLSERYSKFCEDKDFYYLLPLSVIIIGYMIIVYSGNVVNLSSVVTNILISILVGSIVAGFVCFYRLVSGNKEFLYKSLFEKILTILKWIIIFNIINKLYSNGNIVIAIGLILLLIANKLYSRNLQLYSEEGLRKKEYIEGLRMYIKTAEENQIKKFNSTEELVKYFKGILPYAVALNVQNEAIKLMEKTIEINSSLTGDSRMMNEINSLYAYSREKEIKAEIFEQYIVSTSSSRSYSSSSSSSSFSGSGSGYSSGGSGYTSGSGYSGGGSGGGGGGEW